jgi:hypothetical protein
MYRGARGAEVAFLIRRLRARLGVTDRPDKFSVICTSASLGRGDDARENARRFAADLTGLAPESFAVVTGEPRGADALRAGLGGARGDARGDRPRRAPRGGGRRFAPFDALAPLFDRPRRGAAGRRRGGDPAARALRPAQGEGLPPRAHPPHRGRGAGAGGPGVGAIPRGAARAQGDRGAPDAGRARPPAPGRAGPPPDARPRHVPRPRGALRVPRTAVRGPSGAPGAEAPVGKLFTEPRPHCDACGSRVYEIASCRECGAVYYLAWTVLDPSGAPDFLWNERSGDLTGLQLLAEEPRDRATTRACWSSKCSATTGAVLSGRQSLGAGELAHGCGRPSTASSIRSRTAFAQCPMCQPAGRAAADPGARLPHQAESSRSRR